MSSKNTHWKYLGSNIDNEKTREERILNQKKSFKDTLAINRMKVIKPKFVKKKKDNSEENEEIDE